MHLRLPFPISVVRRLKIVDINQDGDDDIVGIGNTGLFVSLGNGDGTFGDADATFLNIAFARSFAIGLFDDDEHLDIAISGTTVGVLLGNGDGTFGEINRIFGIGGVIEVADVNGDDELDLINSNFANNVSISLGDGNGGFGAPSTFSTPDSARDMIIGDFDGNGTVDIATLNEGSNGAEITATISILLGNGDGTFASENRFDVGRNPDSLAAADVNFDGNLDLLVNGDTVGGGSVLVLLPGFGDGTFAAQRRFAAGFDPNDPGTFSLPAAVTLVDANNDSNLDIVTANASGDISLLLGDGDGGFADQVKFATGANAIALVAGMFNADANVDVITASSADSTLSVLIGDGQGSFADAVSIPLSAIPTSIRTAKLDSNDTMDLVVGLHGDQIAVFLGNGDGTFGDEMLLEAGASFASSQSHVSVADVDNDGVLDIISANAFLSGSITLLIGNGDGTFAAPISLANAEKARRAIGADLNQDGLTDIVATIDASSFNGGSGHNSAVFFGVAGGGFSEPLTLSDLLINELVKAVDIDGDANLDVITTGGFGSVVNSEINIALGNGSGSFMTDLHFSAGQRISDLAFGDLNNDGALDIVSTHSESRDVSVLLNQRPPEQNGGGEGEFIGTWGTGESSEDDDVIDEVLANQDSWLNDPTLF